MNQHNFSLAHKYVKPSYVLQASQAIAAHECKVSHLLEQGRCPDDGWDDSTIELLLHELSLMDSNNFMGNCGVGEREARIVSNIVRRRHYRMGHGIGRSGDIAETQPKAAGSSLINKLTNSMVLHVLQFAGVPNTKSCFVVPMATGMSLVLCMLSFRQRRPEAKYVVWSRIDQKSCLKSMLTAGYKPIIIECVLRGDQLQTDVGMMGKKVQELGADNIACVLTTTSCFAPRAPDDLEGVAKMCKEFNIPHLVNNAYGVQSTKCMHLIEQASRAGRVDAYVQSTDKNFLVPVGGAVIAGFDKTLVEGIAKTYPGRGSGSPTLDLFITLLSVGKNGYLKLRNERKQLFQHLVEQLSNVVGKYGQRVLHTPGNQISVAFTLPDEVADVTAIGAMLFTRFVSGARAVGPGKSQTVAGLQFLGWGSHCDHYPCSYLTAASALGVTREDVDTFLIKLDKVMQKVKSTDKKNGDSISVGLTEM
ncbi:O-phosphoseryl-tRNA(Sec) selenium transferase-like [Ornithodoros turicata]|uniref:O-phosphoseryl-tRNA(Sec) selenium transferase-like n=1 Tax=Ornithodoros turicata TaxID=34597 RepID=UPI00313A2E59